MRGEIPLRNPQEGSPVGKRLDLIEKIAEIVEKIAEILDGVL